MTLFQYSFMQRAFIIGILIALIAALIGVHIVLKRLSMIGDSLSHSSLAGVTVGLVCGINPLIPAVVMAVAASALMEFFRQKYKSFSEIALAIVFTVAVGITGVVSGFVRNVADFNSFLFGSIVAVTDFELVFVVALCVVVITLTSFLYKELFYIAFDEEAAKISGVPVKAINFVFMVLTAVTVSVSARTVGVLIISSLLVVPTATALQISKSYKQTVLYTLLFSELSMIIGLYASYELALKPGGTIALTSVSILLAVMLFKKIRRVR